MEAAEFIVRDGSEIIGTPLSELRLSQNVLVASIVRGSQVILPRGNDCLQAGDSVIVVTKNIALTDLEDVLS